MMTMNFTLFIWWGEQKNIEKRGKMCKKRGDNKSVFDHFTICYLVSLVNYTIICIAKNSTCTSFFCSLLLAFDLVL